MIGFSSSSNVIREEETYSGLILEKSQILPSAFGVKAVLFNPEGTKLYALNLEGGSIYEFSQSEKTISKKIIFQQTKAQGLDYRTHRTISSFAEKPVEGCFSHKILWVSFHNAGGIMPISTDFLPLSNTDKNLSYTKAVVIDLINQRKDTISLPLIKTGKTPKVIAKTADQNNLLVSNWSSNTISLLKLNDTLAPYGKKIASFNMPSTPRGIAIDDKNNRSYITIMGGNKIIVINNKTWKVERSFIVPANPRHILAGNDSRLFVSFNASAKIACIDARTGEILFIAKTGLQPRTIVLSENQKFLFVTCYGGNSVDIFKITSRAFTRIYTLSCTGKPVGIAIYENEDKLEAWVGNYIAGNLKVFTFKKVY